MGDSGSVFEESLLFVLEAAGLGWWYLDLAENRTVRSLGHDALFGYDELLPSWSYEDFLAHIHPEDRDRVAAAFARALAGGSEYAEDLRVVWADGTVRWVFTRGAFELGPDGTPRRVAGVMGDITDRKLLELRALDSLANAAALVDSTADAVVRTDLDGTVQSWNAGAAELFDVPARDAVGRCWLALLDSDGERVLEAVRAAGQGRTTRDLAVVQARADGSEVEATLTVSPLQREGRIVGASVLGHDTSGPRALQQALAHQAGHDLLTGLPNRNLLAERLAEALASDEAVTVLFLDLDEFKVINDAAGHLVGDVLLTMLGRRLSRAVGREHLLSRFGGDEFVLVCRDLSEERALALAQRLHEAVRPAFEVAGGRFYVSASIGIAHDRAIPGRRTGGEELLSRADTAMYDAKSHGRNRTSVFDDAMAARVRETLELTNDLREALERGQLELWYQPVVDLATGAVMGLEALARWDHPTRGQVPADVFIGMAEHRGLITGLDRWAVRQAGRDAAALRAAGVLGPTSRMAVNVSAKAVTDGVLPALVLESTPPEELQHLVLEITETGVMADPEQARVELQALHGAGVRIAIDDFGVGQSSLSYLQRFPVSVLKLDRSFVQGMTTSPDDRAIVRSVLTLAQDTGLVAVAEGVETEAQRQALLELGCPLAQGYLWSPALPLPRLVEWLEARDRLVRR